MRQQSENPLTTDVGKTCSYKLPPSIDPDLFLSEKKPWNIRLLQRSLPSSSRHCGTPVRDKKGLPPWRRKYSPLCQQAGKLARKKQFKESVRAYEGSALIKTSGAQFDQFGGAVFRSMVNSSSRRSPGWEEQKIVGGFGGSLSASFF